MLNSGVISSLSSGRLTLHPAPSTSADGSSSISSVPLSYTVDGPVLALTTPSSSSTTFALAGKEVDVSIREIERTFSSSSRASYDDRSKRRRTELVEGEIWRAKNVVLPSSYLRGRWLMGHRCQTTPSDFDRQSIISPWLIFQILPQRPHASSTAPLNLKLSPIQATSREATGRALECI